MITLEEINKEIEETDAKLTKLYIERTNIESEEKIRCINEWISEGKYCHTWGRYKRIIRIIEQCNEAPDVKFIKVKVEYRDHTTDDVYLFQITYRLPITEYRYMHKGDEFYYNDDPDKTIYSVTEIKDNCVWSIHNQPAGFITAVNQKTNNIIKIDVKSFHDNPTDIITFI